MRLDGRHQEPQLLDYRRFLLVIALLSVLFGANPFFSRLEAQGRRGTVEAAAQEARFVASSRGQVYYPKDCTAWRTLSPANLIGFRTEQEASAAGYRRSGNSACGWSGQAAAAPARPAAPRGLPSPDNPSCRIASVTDGDTVVCDDGRRVRLLLIDAPELSQGEYGRLAKQELEQLLPVGTVARLAMDVQPSDRYRRLLAYIYTGNFMVNEEMVRRGYAVVSVYPPNVRFVDRMRAAAAEAQRARRGLWSGSAFDCAPADYRAGRCRR